MSKLNITSAIIILSIFVMYLYFPSTYMYLSIFATLFISLTLLLNSLSSSIIFPKDQLMRLRFMVLVSIISLTIAPSLAQFVKYYPIPVWSKSGDWIEYYLASLVYIWSPSSMPRSIYVSHVVGREGFYAFVKVVHGVLGVGCTEVFYFMILVMPVALALSLYLVARFLCSNIVINCCIVCALLLVMPIVFNNTQPVPRSLSFVISMVLASMLFILPRYRCVSARVLIPMVIVMVSAVVVHNGVGVFYASLIVAASITIELIYAVGGIRRNEEHHLNLKLLVLLSALALIPSVLVSLYYGVLGEYTILSWLFRYPLLEKIIKSIVSIAGHKPSIVAATSPIGIVLPKECIWNAIVQQLGIAAYVLYLALGALGLLMILYDIVKGRVNVLLSVPVLASAFSTVWAFMHLLNVSPFASACDLAFPCIACLYSITRLLEMKGPHIKKVASLVLITSFIVVSMLSGFLSLGSISYQASYLYLSSSQWVQYGYPRYVDTEFLNGLMTMTTFKYFSAIYVDYPRTVFVHNNPELADYFWTSRRIVLNMWILTITTMGVRKPCLFITMQNGIPIRGILEMYERVAKWYRLPMNFSRPLEILSKTSLVLNSQEVDMHLLQ